MLISEHNPFSSRFTTPGAIPFHFEKEWIRETRNRLQFSGDSLVEQKISDTELGLRYLVQLIKNQNGYGQITGPHGTGKSNLLHSLTTLLQEDGWNCFSCVLHDSQRRLEPMFMETLENSTKVGKPRIVLIDGYEQLSMLERFRIRIFCHIKKFGLTITTHRPVFGLPVIYGTKCSLTTLRHLVSHLQADKSRFAGLLPELHRKRDGNVREIFFDLYDLYEEERPTG